MNAITSLQNTKVIRQNGDKHRENKIGDLSITNTSVARTHSAAAINNSLTWAAYEQQTIGGPTINEH